MTSPSMRRFVIAYLIASALAIAFAVTLVSVHDTATVVLPGVSATR